MRVFIFLLCFLAAVMPVYGAIVEGTVYDLELNRANDAIVTVNSSPQQRLVAENGEYSFELEKGNYQLTASYDGSKVTENYSVNSDGKFVFDIIIYPELDYDVDDVDFGDELLPEEGSRTSLGIIIAVFAIIAAALLAHRLYRKRKAKRVVAEDMGEDDLKLVLDTLKKHGGRITQLELRKEIPLSEAKISLMVSELESKGAIRKIKKGRANIIILEK